MLVSQVYSHKYVRYFAYKNIYSLPRSRNGLSLLLNSAISWVWWGTAPPAPNVETPLQVKKTESAGLTADLDESAGLTAVHREGIHVCVQSFLEWRFSGSGDKHVQS